MDQNYTLQTVDRAIAFLEHVAAASKPPTVRDVAEALDLNITTCYHLLRTLVARGYVQRNEDGGLELGDRVGLLARGYRRAQNTEQYLSGVVKQLSIQTRETATLSLREGNSVVLKVLIEGTQRLRVAGLYVGLKGHEYRRAAGKAVLAHLDNSARNAMLKASVTELPERQRKMTLKSLEKELALTASRGWSLDDQTEEGIVAIGAPIFQASGSVIGAVAIVLPAFRMEKSRQMFLGAVLAAAAEANELLKNNR